LVPPVTGPASKDHVEGGEDVRWRDQALRSTGGKAHSGVQDLRQEVCKSVGHGGDRAKNDRIAPDLPVGTAAEPFLEVEWFDSRVASVGVDTSNDPSKLVGGEEADGSRSGVIWEGDQEDESKSGYDNSKLVK